MIVVDLLDSGWDILKACDAPEILLHDSQAS